MFDSAPATGPQRMRQHWTACTFWILASVVVLTESISAQSLEWQVYPTGVIVVAGHTFRPNNTTEGRLIAGFNITDRGNGGIQDHESGHGFGGGIDINKKIPFLGSRWMAGGRADVWSMKINWRHDALNITADSRTLVFQPTARLIYRIRHEPETSLKSVGVSLSFGLQKNIATHGQPVSDGSMLLLGARIAI